MAVVLTYKKFFEFYSDSSIILIGAGKRAQQFVEKGKFNIKCVIDSDDKKRGTEFNCRGYSSVINDWDFLRNNYASGDVVVITPAKGYLAILDRINEVLGKIDNCIVLSYMDAFQWDFDRIRESNVPFEITKGKKTRIPKIIHYFWFSGDPYPEKVQRCLDSWHKHCPDYEFKLWNLENYHTDNVFCNEALSNRVWAFASDFGRCDVLYRYGGIYLDLDVELLKPLDDLLYDDGFLCFESADGVDPGSGMGCVKGNPIWGEICNKYEGLHFINDDGSFNKVNILRQYTSVLEEHGLRRTGIYQNFENVAVYPPLVLSPYSYQTGVDSRYEKTYGVHHWVSAWITEEERHELEERKKVISKYVTEHGGIEKLI